MTYFARDSHNTIIQLALTARSLPSPQNGLLTLCKIGRWGGGRGGRVGVGGVQEGRESILGLRVVVFFNIILEHNMYTSQVHYLQIRV